MPTRYMRIPIRARVRKREREREGENTQGKIVATNAIFSYLAISYLLPLPAACHDSGAA